MRNLTIQEVIKAVPLEEETKKKYLESFDLMDEDKKFEFTRIVWRAFYMMKDVITQDAYRQLVNEVAEGKRESVKDLMVLAEDTAWQDIEDRISGKKQENDKLNSIREQLHQYLTDTNH